jgi:predicted GNAT family N-acyltransferase
MSVSFSYGLFVCIEDAALLERLRGAIQGGLLKHSEVVQYGPVEPQFCALAEVEARLADWLKQPSYAAIILSDQLVDQNCMTAAAKALYDQFGEQLYASVAVTRRPKRILDIDRALSWYYTDGMLARVLHLAVARLAYLAPPVRQLLPKLRIRPIATDTELCNYFKLRHQVYTPMSYLEEMIEETTTQMDIDWFDKQAVHLGAFGEQDQLLGTARIITTELVNETHRERTMRVAAQDPVLEARVIYGGAPLALLPVFQSDNHFDGYLEAMHAVIRGLRFAELSRVIVHPDYRGAGLSLDLVTAAVDVARQHDVFEIFLECLPIHERLYRKAEFRVVAGARGSVYGVDRTMIVMHRPLLGTIVKPADPEPAPALVPKKSRGARRG